MAAPKVSILIPTYNQPDYLRQALKSIAMQTYKDMEVIITDDSEDDSVLSVVTEFSSDLKIRYFKNKVRKGSPENWNEAVAKSSGEYIKFLHHDDWFADKDSLQAYVQALENNPQADFAFSCTNVCDTDRAVLYIQCPTNRELSRLRKNPVNLFPDNFVGAPSATIYRRSVNKLFDTRLKWVVDIDFYISILKENPVFVFIPKNAVCFTSGAHGQVTLECLNNKKVEMFEWIYLFNKINDSKITVLSHIFFIWILLLKHEITTINELREYNIDPVPAWIPVLVAVNPILIPFVRIIKYLKKRKANNEKKR
jgi:glycosyltransferase involved in cell wall biosynthesis